MRTTDETDRFRLNPFHYSGVLIGFGLGGLFDGIVFHQILQWHSMLSAHPDPNIAMDPQLNVMADGIFHLSMWIITVGGIILLWKSSHLEDLPRSGKSLFGAFLMGWGLFNIVEGIINHFILGVHHVRPGGPGWYLLWDIAFLGWGASFLVIGYLLVRS